MTFLQLQDMALNWLDDTDAGYFSRPTIKQWINNAQFELQKRLLKAGENWYLKCVQTTCVVNQSDYVQPSDFLKSHRLVIVDSPGTTSEVENALGPVTTNEQDFIGNQAAKPCVFFFKKSRVVVVPKPDSTYTMRLYYSYRVAPMVQDAETPDCPEQYHELLAVLAAIDGMIKDGRDPSSLMAKKKEYDEMMAADAESRIENSPRYVVSTGSY